jgi:phage tail tape-measure protein
MKNILLTLSAAVVLLAACKSEKKNALDIDKSIVFTDTSALKQGNYSTDVATQGNNAPVAAPEEKAPESKPQIRTITKVIHVKDKPDPVVQATPPAPQASTPTVPIIETPAPVATAPAAGTGTALPGTTTAPAEAKKKEGWSGAAKGTAIGAIGGAVAGAVIGKGKGAIIGGVVGAAGGYILGKKADKKSGRSNLIQP